MKSTDNILFSIISAAMIAYASPYIAAYDFSELNSHGKRIYYNQLSDTEAEVTYESKLSPTYSYSGELELPAMVLYDGTYLKVTSIGERAFFGCRPLTKITIPPTVTSIGTWAFGWCDSITSIVIPESVTAMGADVFDGCLALSNIEVENGNQVFESQGDGIYSGGKKTLVACRPTTEGIFIVPEGTESIGQRAFGGCMFVDSVKIASTVREIGNDAFSYCNSLKSIYLPEAVEEIGDKALSDCFSLEKILADTDNKHFASHEGTLYSSDFSKLIQSPGANPCAVPHPQMREIAPWAYMHNYGLTTIILPATTEIIGEAAFAGCESLESVVIQEGVTHIGDMAFGLCDNLENVYSMGKHPEKITVGEGAFASNGNGLRTLYVPRGCREAYMASEKWHEIGNIVETDAFLPQTISWDKASDRNIDECHVEMGAKSSSGLEVRYRISAMSEGVAVLEGNKLEILTPGPVYVTAYQPGDSAYLPAEPVTMVYNELTGADDPEILPDIRVSGGRGEIVIIGAPDDAIADVYSTDGIKFYSGTSRCIKVTGQRIYMVRIGSRTHKVAVR